MGIVLPAVLFGGLYAWPFIERAITGDGRACNIDDMPYDKPWWLGAGVAIFTFVTAIGFAGSDDIQAKIFHIDVEVLMVATVWTPTNGRSLPPSSSLPLSASTSSIRNSQIGSASMSA